MIATARQSLADVIEAAGLGRPQIIEDGVLHRFRAPGDREPNSWYVAPGDGRFRDISNLWERLRTDAGLGDFRLHDCRHDFASRLAMAGVDLAVIRELLGHSDFSLTLRYAHLQPAKRAEAVERIASRPSNLVQFRTKKA